jgi:hypothetical protein
MELLRLNTLVRFEQLCLVVGDGIAASVRKALDVSEGEMKARHFNLY